MMKLLVVTRESAADRRFGLGRSLNPLLKELEDRDVEIGYLSLADAGQRSRALVQFFQVNFFTNLLARCCTKTNFPLLIGALLERLNMGRLAARVMAREGYTHVHCHDPFIAAGYRLFSRLSFGRKVKWGLTEHGFGSYTQSFHDYGIGLGSGVMRWLKCWESRVLLSAFWVISPTVSARAQLSRDLSNTLIPDSWHAIYHARPQIKKLSRENARHSLGWDSKCFYIIAVGQFIPLKQFEVLIKACASLTDYNFKVVLIGDGNQSGILDLAEKLKVDDHLNFASVDDMSAYYSAADIYCSMSISESFGLANLEAISMGLPSICTAVGGVPEVVGTGAWLIPASDDLVLAMAIRTLLDSDSARAELSRRALNWARGWPDSSEIAEAYLNIYQGNKSSCQKRPELPLGQDSDCMDSFHQRVKGFDACPLPRSLHLPDKGRVMIFAPHSDDETLGCGGTLHLLKQKGHSIKLVIITDGAKGDPLGYSQTNAVNERRNELKSAMRILGIDDIEFMSEPDGEYIDTDSMQGNILRLLGDYQPDWLFVPSILDYHRDHTGIGLTLLDCWQQRGCKERFFLYEVWQPVPATWLVDISKVFKVKEKALKCFKLPLRYYDYLSMSSGLSSYRGSYLPKKNGRAEAFLELEKKTWKSVVTPLFSLKYHQDKVLGSD